ncbi:TPA_exp: Uncharacterized protein A8136_0480 [Trichophyton benhamiae CBS 112371]|uniref:Aminoglycoside phosphotransferase domain-containing protein n=1 Tax=Arthroderma benhamiae (strain ATCC MYA-4681 / CBS 112371) TaxID=663331 RepID=D4AJN9_ARTBC|nr:uncharacterized protein ARB_04489 [Trichophyton benhamiae CBS 112371]EFE36962.1 hypothetical protein ARB_04489 [Trichophyton benhamiae CBS 112371]DAA79707.1 TPA_exp: Uncharacterized protein A8136_0480 [Trichophyton benhamiae CBS 112371]
MSFDFDSYFMQLDPLNSWTVKRLTGGLVNLTVRATKNKYAGRENETASQPGQLEGCQSLILKYAPPFVASVGEAAPFDQIRQNVEKNALALFSAPDGPLLSMLTETSVRVPSLVFHDEKSHILVLEDLGALPPLSDLLSISWLSSHYPEWPSLSGSYFLEDRSLCLSAGAKFGQFFAILHDKGTLNSIKSYGCDPNLARFKNNSMREVVRDAAVSTMRRYLVQFNCVEAEKLSHAIEEDFERQEEWDGERCFSVGDLWPGGILIENLALQPSRGTHSSELPKLPKLGVIDFEFSGPGRGVNGDMAQLLAHLHLYYIAWGNCGDRFKPFQAGVLSFIEGLCSSYATYSRSLGAPWQLHTPDSSSPGSLRKPFQVSFPPSVSSHAAQIFRSSLLLHGREMVNNAVENDWSKYSIDTRGDVTDTTGKTANDNGSGLTERMVNTGIRCLRLAGNDIESFVEADNWEQVCSSSESSIIARLFVVDSSPLA